MLRRVVCLMWSGVDLFFVLSGFLIGGILIDHKDDNEYFKVFYIRRFCRIYPIYLILLAVWAINSRIGVQIPGVHFPIWSFLCFLQTVYIVKYGTYGDCWYGVTWTLAIEEHFYLFFPMAIRVCKRRNIPHLMVVLILLAPVFRAILWSISRPPGETAVALLPCRMDQLALGALGAWMMREPTIRRWMETHLTWIYTYFGIFGASLVVLSMRNWGLTSAPIYSFGYTWIGIFYLLLILVGVLSPNRLVIAVYKFWPLRMLGRVSYFVYLAHLGAQWILFELLLHHAPQLYTSKDYGVTGLAIAVTIGLAIPSWFLIEKPIINWGHRWRYKPAPTTPELPSLS